MIKQMLMVGMGGAAGSMLRFAVSLITSRFYTGLFPVATFVVNVTGCFLIGVLAAQIPASAEGNGLRYLLITGFCGGYTTFSAFSYENLQLINNGHTVTAAGYIFASVVVGLAAVWLGVKTG